MPVEDDERREVEAAAEARAAEAAALAEAKRRETGKGEPMNIRRRPLQEPPMERVKDA
jgi:hypothetical protein